MDSPTARAVAKQQKDAVRNGFKTWKDLGIGLTFEEVTDPDEASIRIDFENKGSWSYVGRDCLRIPSTAQTMNFGWDLTTDYGKVTVLHEIGHALGFPHEHQNPKAGIVWNREAVINYFSGSPNFWDSDKIERNIFRKIDQGDIEGSNWDPDSVMHYSFRAGLIQEPAPYDRQGISSPTGLSDTDILQVRTLYPPLEEEPTFLVPFISSQLSLDTGEQVDFLFKPDASREYTIQTFGKSDLVMVLFEEVDGVPVYLDGDDDSGFEMNAKLKRRLLKGRTYIVRLRLYFGNIKGNGAVLLY